MTTLLTRRNVLATGGTLAVLGASGTRALPALPQSRPEDIGIDPKKLARAYDLLDQWTTGKNDQANPPGPGRRGRR